MKLTTLILSYMAACLRLLAPGGVRAIASDNNPLFQFHRWKANLRILDVKEMKSVPHAPTSHPLIERLIGTVRRELLEKTLFWNANDLQNKLNSFQHDYNEERCHHGMNKITPRQQTNDQTSPVISITYGRVNPSKGINTYVTIS